MAKRSHKAHRGTRRNRQGRPQTSETFSPPVAPSPDPIDQHSLVGAILAAAESVERTTLPEIAPRRMPDLERVDPLGQTVVGHRIVEVAPMASEPAQAVAADDEDPMRSSLDDFDAAFFAQPVAEELELRTKQESFPPVSDDLVEPKKAEPPSPALIARRLRLRKVVGVVVALAAVVVLGGIGKRLLAADRPVSSLHQTNVAAAVEQRVVAQPVAVQQPATQPVAAPPAATPTVAPRPAADENKPEASPAPAVPDGVEPKAEALRLLNLGKMKEVVPMAQAAIAANPTDAISYLYLGSALQELGKQKDAIAVYSDCVRDATKGHVWECRAMGGKK